MEVEASLRGEDRTTCSTDITEYVQYMVKEHNEDYKVKESRIYQWSSQTLKKTPLIVHITDSVLLAFQAMARDEKNYYQDTPKQIKRKVELYKRCHPEEYAAFIASLQSQKSTWCHSE